MIHAKMLAIKLTKHSKNYSLLTIQERSITVSRYIYCLLFKFSQRESYLKRMSERKRKRGRQITVISLEAIVKILLFEIVRVFRLN